MAALAACLLAAPLADAQDAPKPKASATLEAPAGFAGTWRVRPDQVVDGDAAVAPVAGADQPKNTDRSWYLVPRGSWKGEVERVELRREMVQLLATTNTFEFQLAPGEVRFYSGDVSRVQYLGREHFRDDRMGRRLKTKTVVSDQQLGIVSVWPDGMRLSETYTLLPGGQELTATLEWESEHFVKPFELVRRYTRVPPPAK